MKGGRYGKIEVFWFPLKSIADSCLSLLEKTPKTCRLLVFSSERGRMHQSTGRDWCRRDIRRGSVAAAIGSPHQDDVGIAWLSLLRTVSIGGHGLSHGMLGGAAYAGLG